MRRIVLEEWWVAAAVCALAACAGGNADDVAQTTVPPAPAVDAGTGGAVNAASGADAGAPDAPADAASGADASDGAVPALKSGVLLFGNGAPIVGAAYAGSGAQGASGTTDATGGFHYADGAPVAFRIGDLALGSAPGAATLSPYQLAASASCDDTDAVKKLAAVLEALDADGDASNGIALPAAPASGSPVDVAQGAWSDLATRVAALGGKPLAAPDDALRAFIVVFDAEQWAPVSTDTFALTNALLRGQGVATDGTSWFFSGTTGLERTDASFASQASNAFAIPLPLVALGSDHIGDIDFFGGKIYAPVEDKNYQAPKVILYDPQSLASGQVFDIPQSLQTKGVPWVAVDGPRAVAYTAEWDPTPEIHVYALGDMTYTRSIELSTATGRVQGAKVYKGQLYMSVDDDVKHVLKVHLASGTIFPVITLGLSGDEEEGLAFLARQDGSLLHTLDVTSSRTSVEMHHHRITREPLRWSVCP